MRVMDFGVRVRVFFGFRAFTGLVSLLFFRYCCKFLGSGC